MPSSKNSVPMHIAHICLAFQRSKPALKQKCISDAAISNLISILTENNIFGNSKIHN